MSYDHPSIVTVHHTNTMWQWAVIPTSNPHIYIPAPSSQQATEIAIDVDKGTRPELYCYRPVPDYLRTRLGLPDMPRLPKRPDGFRPWQAVSAATAAVLAGSAAITATVESDWRETHVACVPVGLELHRIACLSRRELERRGLAVPAKATTAA